MENKDAITFYEKEYYMLSNFSAFAISWNGKLYATSEHIYQAEKFEDETIREMIRESLSPYDTKRIAHTHKQHYKENWEGTKRAVMKRILQEKVKQHSYIKEKLLLSGTREIIEDSPSDSFWGSRSDGKGENTLGKLWMEIREELRSKEA